MNDGITPHQFHESQGVEDWPLGGRSLPIVMTSSPGPSWLGGGRRLGSKPAPPEASPPPRLPPPPPRGRARPNRSSPQVPCCVADLPQPRTHPPPPPPPPTTAPPPPTHP